MSEQNKQNHGMPAREEGFYRVMYKNTWTIAYYEFTAYGCGWWLLPGIRQEKTDAEFTKIDNQQILAEP